MHKVYHTSTTIHHTNLSYDQIYKTLMTKYKTTRNVQTRLDLIEAMDLIGRHSIPKRKPLEINNNKRV